MSKRECRLGAIYSQEFVQIFEKEHVLWSSIKTHVCFNCFLYSYSISQQVQHPAIEIGGLLLESQHTVLECANFGEVLDAQNFVSSCLEILPNKGPRVHRLSVRSPSKRVRQYIPLEWHSRQNSYNRYIRKRMQNTSIITKKRLIENFANEAENYFPHLRTTFKTRKHIFNRVLLCYYCQISGMLHFGKVFTIGISKRTGKKFLIYRIA